MQRPRCWVLQKPEANSHREVQELGLSKPKMKVALFNKGPKEKGEVGPSRANL